MSNRALACDVLVVGGGIAGFSAAIRAAELGRRVILVEKGTARNYPCNTRFSGGVFHVAHTDMTADPAVLEKVIADATNGFVRQELAVVVASNSGRVVRWLRDQGTKFINLSIQHGGGKAGSPGQAHHGWVLAPPSIRRAGPDWDNKGGDVMLQRLEKNLVERGGTFMRGVRVRTLVMDAHNRCVGAEAQAAEGDIVFSAFATVLADGGFQADSDLLRRYVSAHPEGLQQRNARTGTGDGLRMALEVGAATVGVDRFYGHLLSRDAMANDRLWPKPQLDSLAVAGIVVSADGRRVGDEGLGAVYLCNVLAGLDDPLSTFAVFDRDIWEGPGAGSILANVPANPVLRQEGGTLHEAADIGALAALMGVPGDALGRTIADYNEAIDTNRLPFLSPPRSAGRIGHGAIRRPPFYAAPLCAGITYTMGGIAVDGKARVLDESGAAIPGLFAAGTTTGGFEGGPRVGYVGGLSRASVMGYCAAEAIAAEFAAAA